MHLQYEIIDLRVLGILIYISRTTLDIRILNVQLDQCVTTGSNISIDHVVSTNITCAWQWNV